MGGTTRMNFLNLDDKELDQHIYRIMPQEYVFSLFSDRQNVLSKISNWKDKFENFQLNLGGTLDGERFNYSFKDDFVGQCWTRHSLSEAMWGIYANDPSKRYLRIRSTPRKLLTALATAHPRMPQDTCFVGAVSYETEPALKAYLANNGRLEISALGLARSLLLKRRAFKHEAEIRLLHFGDAGNSDPRGLYRYPVDPHDMITQIMADPNRDRRDWKADRAAIAKATGFSGQIKRSKIYDPPGWDILAFTS
ncbi:DUF2971 domain-containing protein [Brucella anthropi]|uniref:DUF2971 domain-containing protein n=2 Tax=Brucella/Ochrobactrum group TaxID=2826938 RepID=UPI00124E529F|nr:DUF2971 domain-containing protein [Brucella anthropi]KAB2756666.1 DUF2971 domain-containing protein [Brucella anthropi]